MGDPNDYIKNYRWMINAYYLDELYWCIFFLATLLGAT